MESTRIVGYLSLNCGGGGGISICRLSRLLVSLAALVFVASLSDIMSDVKDSTSSKSEAADFSLNAGRGSTTEKKSDCFCSRRLPINGRDGVEAGAEDCDLLLCSRLHALSNVCANCLTFPAAGLKKSCTSFCRGL